MTATSSPADALLDALDFDVRCTRRAVGYPDCEAPAIVTARIHSCNGSPHWKMVPVALCADHLAPFARRLVLLQLGQPGRCNNCDHVKWTPEEVITDLHAL